MLVIERHQQILDILKKEHAATVSSLAKRLYIGEATIRRDLERLQEQGMLRRTYGGAVLLEGIASEIPLYVRENEQRQAKARIGLAAASLVNSGDIIIMDSSSTTYMMSRFLSDKDGLTIITNGAKTAITLGEKYHFNVYSTGGRLRENSLSYIGGYAKSFVDNIHADTLFFSCRSFSPKGGLYDSSEEEAELRKTMLSHASRHVLLCDASKWGTNAFYRICDSECLDYIITDAQVDKESEALLSDSGITLVRVGEK